ncbi:MAG: hypothetical protein ACR2PB_11320 [Desulfocapsaceae bacterium]
MTENDDSYKVILTSFEDEYEETHDSVWVWHAMDFCSTWQRKTGTMIPYPQWVYDYLSAAAATILKLDDEKNDVSDKIVETISIRKHSISSSIRTIRDKLIFFEIQSMINQGMDTNEAISGIAKMFSLPEETVQAIYQRFQR